MPHASKNHRSGHPFRLPPRLRRIFWPVVTLSGGGTAITLWMQEEAVLLMDCAPIAAIPGLAAVLYWFNHHIFKEAMPRPEDLKTPSTRNNLHREKN